MQPISSKRRRRKSQTMTYKFDQNWAIMRTEMRWHLSALTIRMRILVMAAKVRRRSKKLMALSSTITSP